MAERRELTERNRENQQPGQPIDFCQGLPFKVRWMGRDTQTGRDLVQFPDGSIVRAGKRIFSGNCPRGTMVDVVDCGANGAITIDWRDAEIRQPILIPDVPEKWSGILDGGVDRFVVTEDPFFDQFFDGASLRANARKYLANVKGDESVLLVSLELASGSFYNPQDSGYYNAIFDEYADAIFYDYTDFTDDVVKPERIQGLAAKGIKKESIESIGIYDQVWAYASAYEYPEPVLNAIIANAKKLVLFADFGVGERSIDAIARARFKATFLPDIPNGEWTPQNQFLSWYYHEFVEQPGEEIPGAEELFLAAKFAREGSVKVFEDPVMTGVKPMLGIKRCFKVSPVSGGNIKVLSTVFCKNKLDPGAADKPIIEYKSVIANGGEDVPFIAVVR